MEKSLLEQLRDSQELQKGSNGSGTTTCYLVQARCCKGCGPKEIRGATTGMGKSILTDTAWETLYFPKSPIGVPPSRFNEEYARHGYYSYQAAQALRWWFLAEQAFVVGAETRLVQYTFKYSYSAEPVRAICLIDPEQREDILPDWGQAEALKTNET